MGTAVWPKTQVKDLGLLVLLPVSIPLHTFPWSQIARRHVLLESLLSAHLKISLSPSLFFLEHKQKWTLVFTEREIEAQRGSAACPGVPRAPG